MLGLPIAFAAPWVLLALLTVPIIWYLLRLTPPKPQDEVFPPTMILEKLSVKEETPAKSPWWLTLLRLGLATLLIFAMAGPIWNPREALLKEDGPILLIVDDGWASGGNWDQMKSMALDISAEARQSNRTLTLLLTSNPDSVSENPVLPDDIDALLEAASNRSIEPDHENSAAKIRKAAVSNNFGEAIFLSDGLGRNTRSDALLSSLTEANINTTIISPQLEDLAVLGPIENQPAKMTGLVSRALTDEALPLRVIGLDKDGLAIARSPVTFAVGEKVIAFNFEQPVELRNQITRVEIENTLNAGGVQLLDDNNRRRIVGLISGQSADVSQPLLSPLYYINRALAPFSDLRIPDTSNLEEAATELIAQKVSAIVMADIGTLPQEAKNKFTKFVEEGGLIIRFAGPRLAGNPDSALLPVDLVQGDRFIGGALSWETPKEVAAFDPSSPFFGLDRPKNVTVSRQVLAIQNGFLDERTWARLEDGTPLVTANQVGDGWIILFHVNSDNNWSNLPLSGSFVDMLRRSVNLSRSTNTAAVNETALRLPPIEVLDGQGDLLPPDTAIKPLEVEAGITPSVTIENPPGYYGTSDGFLALNLIREGTEITPLDTSRVSGSFATANYANDASFDFKPWMLLIAAILFLIDCLAVLWFAGVFKAGMFGTRAKRVMGSIAALAGAFLVSSAFLNPSFAQNTETPIVDFSATLQTRFAYVETGDLELDRVSRLGLLGLSRFIGSRTALEPGDPVGVDIAVDELAFYPFLYWPVTQETPIPSEAAMARIDAYMKQGGSILFDTKDQFNAILNSTNAGGNQKLRQILASLDIPPLEPVPADHVLTKSFFLLDSFPGRYQGGDLWIEQIGTAAEDVERPARAGDGVSTILITSNDFAGAWAIDENNRSLFQTVPPSNGQREYAFRVGVNIAMYTITGNYKADQVHIPALLERLGQ